MVERLFFFSREFVKIYINRLVGSISLLWTEKLRSLSLSRWSVFAVFDFSYSFHCSRTLLLFSFFHTAYFYPVFYVYIFFSSFFSFSTLRFLPHSLKPFFFPVELHELLISEVVSVYICIQSYTVLRLF